MNVNKNAFQYEIISGIDPRDIKDYFLEICATQEDKSKFYGSGWTVELDDLGYRTLGIIQLPTTRILFTGEEKICEVEIHRYRMKFLTAGG